MILLSVDRLVKYFGPEPVLSGVTFDIRPGQRVGLVGPNGAGKSTLLNIVAGRLEADSGRLERHSSARCEYLEQHAQFEPGRTVEEEARSALREVLDLATEAEEVAHAIAAAESLDERARLEQRFDDLQQELHQREGYQIKHRIERVLQGLGFANVAFSQPVHTLSGGQQNRLLLAKMLLTGPELMLLDEPSNHLDLEATRWLEDYLAASSHSLLVVSHDRYFLDRVTTHTLELFQGTVETYTGNFSAYMQQKSERVEVQRRTYEKQQEEIAKLEEFIRRNHYGQKSAQAEDRRKKLERIEPVPPPRVIAAPPMGFPPAARSGDIVIRTEHLSHGFARPLFRDLSFDLLRGERWGILGPNGSGKSTLLKCLLKLINPNEGQVIFGAGVRIGYFDQQLSGLDKETSVVDAVRPTHKEMLTPQRRELLARFGLTGDLVFQPVDSLSGGERNRALLARLAASDANVMLLDEPTNHLDLWARGALERALLAFEGTVVLVSHDRYFLNRVCDHLLVVEADRFRIIEGNYDTYQMLAAAAARMAGEAESAKQAGGERPTSKNARSDSGRRKRKFPYRKTADLETDIHQREARVAALQAELALPETLRDGRLVKQRLADIATEQELLAQLYAHWEEASELN